MAELSIKIRGDISDIESKLRTTEATARATARAISTAFESVGQFASGISVRATQATESLRTMEAQATRSAAALRALQIEQRGGGRIGGGSSFNPTADISGGASLSSLGIGSAGFGAIGAGAAAGAYVIKEAISQSLDLSRANVALATSARQAGVSIDVQRQAAQRLAQELNISTVAATELTAQSTRLALTAGLGPGGGARVTTALANSLVAGGRSLNELPDRLRQLSTGQDELFDVIGGAQIGNSYAASPEQIYKATAAYQGLNRQLTDTEKLQARVNTVLKIGEQNAGAAASSVESLAGQWEFFKRDLLDVGGRGPVAYVSGLLFGGEAKAADVGPAVYHARAEDAYKLDLAKHDAFRAGLGISAFSDIGKNQPITEELRARYGALGSQFLDLQGQAQVDAARFAEEQRAEQKRLLPQRIAALQSQIATGSGRANAAALNIFSLGSRLADLQSTTRLTGFQTGFYGQQTDEGIYSTTYGETPQQRAQRAFAQATSLGEAIKDPAARAAFERGFRLDETKGIGAQDLTYTQRQQLELDLAEQLKSQAEDFAKSLDYQRRAAEALEKLLKAQTGADDEPKPQPSVAIEIKNATDKTASFNNSFGSASVSGDSDTVYY